MAKTPNQPETKETDQNTLTPPTQPSREVVPQKGIKTEVTEYSILLFNSPEKLTNACENALKEGWTLQGGINISHVVSPTQVTSVYAQAITKTKTILA